ncbi:MAG: hypothetical protein K8R31_06045 [Bacteroidales bacterium]|nr:hypothetical protein [Bacteroidales bacterium]
MQQKDFILREIEKISTLLRYLIGKLIPSNSVENYEETIELINRELVENSGFNINEILEFSIKDFDKVLIQNKGYSFENIELLADLLFTLGNDQSQSKNNYLKKTLQLYEYINEKSKTYSFERISKIEEIKELLI